MKSMSVSEIAKLDPAAVVLWVFFPDGPPVDVYEPSENEERVIARSTALETLGGTTAVQALPHLFPQERGKASC